MTIFIPESPYLLQQFFWTILRLFSLIKSFPYFLGLPILFLHSSSLFISFLSKFSQIPPEGSSVMKIRKPLTLFFLYFQVDILDAFEGFSREGQELLPLR